MDETLVKRLEDSIDGHFDRNQNKCQPYNGHDFEQLIVLTIELILLGYNHRSVQLQDVDSKYLQRYNNRCKHDAKDKSGAIQGLSGACLCDCNKYSGYLENKSDDINQ